MYDSIKGHIFEMLKKYNTAPVKLKLMNFATSGQNNVQKFLSNIGYRAIEIMIWSPRQKN